MYACVRIGDAQRTPITTITGLLKKIFRLRGPRSNWFGYLQSLPGPRELDIALLWDYASKDGDGDASEAMRWTQGTMVERELRGDNLRLCSMCETATIQHHGHGDNKKIDALAVATTSESESSTQPIPGLTVSVLFFLRIPDMFFFELGSRLAEITT